MEQVDKNKNLFSKEYNKLKYANLFKMSEWTIYDELGNIFYNFFDTNGSMGLNYIKF